PSPLLPQPRGTQSECGGLPQGHGREALAKFGLPSWAGVSLGFFAFGFERTGLDFELKPGFRIYSCIFTNPGSRKGVSSYMRFVSRYRAILVWLAVLPLSGCLFRSRKLEQPFNYAGIKSATQQELVD